MHIFCQDPERMNNTGSQYLQKKTLQKKQSPLNHIKY